MIDFNGRLSYIICFLSVLLIFQLIFELEELSSPIDSSISIRFFCFTIDSDFSVFYIESSSSSPDLIETSSNFFESSFDFFIYPLDFSDSSFLLRFRDHISSIIQICFFTSQSIFVASSSFSFLFPVRFLRLSLGFELKSISMVKRKGNFKYQATTQDSLKISSPKVRDDPFGSSSPRIASDCPYQSNFRGSTPDSPVITSPKSRDKSYGLLLSRDASDVHDCADFLLIPRLSLSCSIDLRFSLVIAFDPMTCFVMDFYSSFPGSAEFLMRPAESHVIDKPFEEASWLHLMILLVFLFGSLPRPPETSSKPICVIPLTLIFSILGCGTFGNGVRCCSLDSYQEVAPSGSVLDLQSTVGCSCFLTLLSPNVDSGILSIVDDSAFSRYLARRYALSEGELRYLRFEDMSSVIWLRHSLLYSNQLQWTVVVPGSYGLLLRQNFTSATSKRWLLCVMNPIFVGCHVLLQGQSRGYDFIGYTIVARSGWFGSILELLYCSLRRPPEAHYNFSSNTLQFVWYSSSPRCKSLPS